MGAIITNKTQHPFDKYLSSRVLNRKQLTHFSDNAPPGITPHPDPIIFGPGCPNKGVFPIDSLVLNLREKPFQSNTNTVPDFLSSLKLKGNDITKTVEDLKPKETFKSHVSSFTSAKTVITEESGSVKYPFALKDALQYQDGSMPYLTQFTKDLVEKLHHPARDDWGTIFVNGAGDGLNKIFGLFVDRGDTILVEEFTFMPTVWSMEDYGGVTHPVELNLSGDGIDVAKFSNLLANWSTLAPGKKMPKALYTIATGQNPTGLTQSLEHRKQIYKICQKYDIVIVEDDPYGYLILPEYDPEFRSKPSPFDNLSPEDYVKHFIHRSYMGIDVDGRVVRSETFSKMIAPGVRLGFVVANNYYIQKLQQVTMLTTKFASGPSTAIVNSIIQYWGGLDGFLQWGIELSKVYSHRKNVYFETFHQCESYRKGRVTLIDASAGMFISVVLNYPKENIKKYSELMQEFNALTYEHGVIVVAAGTTLALNEEIEEKKGNIIRTTFVFASNDENEIKEAILRLDRCVNDLFKQWE